MANSIGNSGLNIGRRLRNRTGADLSASCTTRVAGLRTIPHIISRNLTPDSTGLPEGGNSLATFIQIMRTGLDTDHVHPTCTGAPNGNCIPAPFDGDLLQIMPWPTFQNMTDDDLTAIYTYLSTIPCLEGRPGRAGQSLWECNRRQDRCRGSAKERIVGQPRGPTGRHSIHVRRWEATDVPVDRRSRKPASRISSGSRGASTHSNSL